ncbi:MAG: hypothetical protein LBI65_03365, partial [Candidatus Symbiothrix sp.]|nr:hypothetical protein [Candidatus Symbiothrix sp.]
MSKIKLAVDGEERNVLFFSTDYFHPDPFIPKEFHEAKLGYYQTEDNVCTPPNADFLWNEIVINVPRKIIYHIADTAFVPVMRKWKSFLLMSDRYGVYIYENKVYNRFCV